MTLELVKECRFEGAYTFVYSSREGTPAANYEDNLTIDDKKKRLYQLNDLVNDGYLIGNERFANKEVKVLVDGVSKNNDEILAGYTENQKLVNFRGPVELIGEIVKVKITDVKTWSLTGELIE